MQKCCHKIAVESKESCLCLRHSEVEGSGNQHMGMLEIPDSKFCSFRIEILSEKNTKSFQSVNDLFRRHE